MMDEVMVKYVIDVSESEATSEFVSLMARAGSDAEEVITSGTRTVAAVGRAESHVRLLSESFPLARKRRSTATLEEEDVAGAIESHREPLSPPPSD